LALDTAADDTVAWDREQAIGRLREIVGFLRGHLMPHAAAEEKVLYPIVEDAMVLPARPRR
jgi:hypothetical protein